MQYLQVRDMNLNRSAVKSVVVTDCPHADTFTFHGNAPPSTITNVPIITQTASLLGQVMIP